MKRTALIDGKTIEYYLIDPTGNITILVVSFVHVQIQQKVASELMNIEPSCEQVGFVTWVNNEHCGQELDNEHCGQELDNEHCGQELDNEYCGQELNDESSSGTEPGIGLVDIKLRMSAGEFCGNATMSTAVLWCRNKEIKPGETMTVTVEASGVSKPVAVNITKNSDNCFAGVVEMPAPVRIYRYDFEYRNDIFNLPIVDFGGISHIILMPDDENVRRFVKLSNNEESLRLMAEEAVKKWCKDIEVMGLGLMFVDITKHYVNNIFTNKHSLDPLVYVPECGTCFWESSCGSGTTAVGAFLSDGDGKKYIFSEPGGVLSIEVTGDGRYMLGGTAKVM